MRPRLVIAPLALALTTALASCGVPAESNPRELSAEGVPFDLLEPGSTTTTSTIPEAGRVATVQIFLVSRERLAPVEREVPAPPLPKDVIETLLEGPTDREADQGLATAIPNGTDLIGVSLNGGVLTMNLSDDINTVQAEVQTQAIAQLVFTATTLPQVEGVRFQVAGKPRDVPIGDGSLQGGAIERGDYPDLDPDRPEGA